MAKFTFEDKLWAVKEYEKGKLSYRDISKQLGTVHQTIQKWVAISGTWRRIIKKKLYKIFC